MKNSRNNVFGLLFTMALLALILFAGCRAFEPEAVVVNKAPETYIIGLLKGLSELVAPDVEVLVATVSPEMLASQSQTTIINWVWVNCRTCPPPQNSSS